MEDTIAAISTPPGVGGIAIVRMSGGQALRIADQIFHSTEGRPSEFASHTIHYGKIGNPTAPLDFVLLTVMRGPKTYTGEDTVEINCHGGQQVASSVLDLCLRHGAKLAEAGEFTKRAFLNGRMDLSQAESVMDLIKARTDLAHRSAMEGLAGNLSKTIQSSRQKLIRVLARLEASIDFPDDEIPDAVLADIGKELSEMRRILGGLQQTTKEGRLLRSGVNVVIVGRPNCGKSSLMNALAGEARSIVTSIPGTTRDLVEHAIEINGFIVRLIDTAGIRTPRGEVERIGVQYARKAIATADIVLHVVDVTRPPALVDDELRNLAAHLPRIIVLNKTDLPQNARLIRNMHSEEAVMVSATVGTGIDRLRGEIALKISRELLHGRHDAYHLNERHEHLVSKAKVEICAAISAIDTGTSQELVANHIQEALRQLGEVDGSEFYTELLDSIFGSFCIGK